MNFGKALELIKKGKAIARDDWGSGSIWLKLYTPTGKGIKRPFIYMNPIDGVIEPWPMRHTDILENDWKEVET